MGHSSVNGLVNENTVQQMYDMIVENARKYLDTIEAPDAKKMQAKGKDTPKPQDQNAGKGYQDFSCYHCGSKEHLIKDFPHKPVQANPPTRVPPKAQPPRKPKGSGKGKGKDGTKRSMPKAKART